MIRIDVCTKFDCTVTGTVGHFKSSSPQINRQGKKLSTVEDWTTSRNQQRNWETFLQLISLRTQPFEIIEPRFDAGFWYWSYQIEFEKLYFNNGDELARLKEDFNQIPMLTGLAEHDELQGILVVDGPKQNIWFEYYTNK